MGNVPPGVTPYGVKFPPSVIVTSPRGAHNPKIPMREGALWLRKKAAV
nr:MAG TPA: hypothetical protein [Caudoviricetes sp.]